MKLYRERKGNLMDPERGKHKTPPAAVRASSLAKLDKLGNPGDDNGCFWSKAETELGYPRRMLQRWNKPEARNKVELWLDANNAAKVQASRGGRSRYWKRLQSKETGTRVAVGGQTKRTFSS